MNRLLTSALCSTIILANVANAQVDEGVFVGQYVAQLKLEKLGYDIGKPDGKIGPKTLAAIKEDATKNGYEASIWGFQKHYLEKAILESKPVEKEETKEKIKAAIGENLLDPYSAVYEDWRFLPSGAVCVDVNAKNSFGAYVGKQPAYVELFFGTPLPVSLDKNRDFWMCYLDPKAP